MPSRTPIDPKRIRKIRGSFSWLDHRLLHDGYLAAMAPEEMLLYFFLVLVGDRQGVSFWSYEKICALLKLDVERLVWARNRLIRKSLIAAEEGRFQVLQLPERPPVFASEPGASRAGRDFLPVPDGVQVVKCAMRENDGVSLIQPLRGKNRFEDCFFQTITRIWMKYLR